MRTRAQGISKTYSDLLFLQDREKEEGRDLVRLCTTDIYLMVVVLVRDALAEAAPEAPAEEAPAFFSKTFQNLSDSSAAAVASI